MGAVTSAGKMANTIFPGSGGLVDSATSLAAGVPLSGATPPPPPPAPAATPPRQQSPAAVTTPRPVFGSLGGTIITGPQGLKDPVSVSQKQLLGG